VAASAVGCTLRFHISIINGATHVLFDSAFGLIEFAFHLIFVRQSHNLILLELMRGHEIAEREVAAFFLSAHLLKLRDGNQHAGLNATAVILTLIVIKALKRKGSLSNELYLKRSS
jgi:hypothetical protein